MHFGEFNPLDVLATAASLQSGGNQTGESGNTTSTGEAGDDGLGDTEGGEGSDGKDDATVKEIPSYFTISDCAENTNNNKTEVINVSTIPPPKTENPSVVLINSSENSTFVSPSGKNIIQTKMVTGKANARQVISRVSANVSTSASTVRSSAGESTKLANPGSTCVVKVLNGDNFNKVPKPVSNKDATTKFVYAGKDGSPKTLTVVRINRGGQIADHSYAIFSQLEKQRSEDDEGYCSRSSLDSPCQSFRSDSEPADHEVFESKDGRATPKSPSGKAGPRSPPVKRSSLVSPLTVLVPPKAGSSAAAAHMASSTVTSVSKCMPVVEAVSSSHDQTSSVLGKKPAKIVIVSRDASLRKLFGSSEMECLASPISPTPILSPSSSVSIEAGCTTAFKISTTSEVGNSLGLTIDSEESYEQDKELVVSSEICDGNKSPAVLVAIGSDGSDSSSKVEQSESSSCKVSITKCDSGVSLCEVPEDNRGDSTENCDDFHQTDISDEVFVKGAERKSVSPRTPVSPGINSDLQLSHQIDLKNIIEDTTTEHSKDNATDVDLINLNSKISEPGVLVQSKSGTYYEGEQVEKPSPESSEIQPLLCNTNVLLSEENSSKQAVDTKLVVLHEMLSRTDDEKNSDVKNLGVLLNTCNPQSIGLKQNNPNEDANLTEQTTVTLTPPSVTVPAICEMPGNLIKGLDKQTPGLTSGAHKYIIEDDVSPVTKFCGNHVVLACSPIPGSGSAKENLASTPLSSSQVLATVSTSGMDSATMPRILLSNSPAVWKMQTSSAVGSTSSSKSTGGNVNICLASPGNVSLFQQVVPKSGARQSMITLPLCSKGVNLSTVTSPKSVGLLALPNRTLVSSQSAFTPLVPTEATSSPPLLRSSPLPRTPSPKSLLSPGEVVAGDSPVDVVSTSHAECKKPQNTSTSDRQTPVKEGRLTPLGPPLGSSEGMGGKINIKISGGVVVDVSPSEEPKDTQRKTATSIGQLGSLTLQSIPAISPMKAPSTSLTSIALTTGIHAKQRKIIKALGGSDGAVYGNRSCHAYTKRRQKITSMGLSQLELSKVRESALTVSRLHPLIDHDYCEFSEFSAEIQSSIIATTATKLKIDQGKGLKKTKAARTKASTRNIPIEVNLEKLRKKRKYTRRKPLLKPSRSDTEQDLLEPVEKKLKLDEGELTREGKFSIVQSKRQKLREKKPKRHYTPRYSTDKNYVKITGSYQDEFVYFATKKSTRGRQRKAQEGANDAANLSALKPATVGGIGVFDYYHEMSKVDKTKFVHGIKTDTDTPLSVHASGKPGALQESEVVDMVMDMMQAPAATETIVTKKEPVVKEELNLAGEIEIKPTPLGNHEGDGDLLPMLDEFLSSLNETDRMSFQQNLSTIATNDSTEIKSESSVTLETVESDKSEDGSRKPSPTSASLVEEPSTAPSDLSAYLNYDEESNHVVEPVLPQVVPASHYLDLDEIEASVDMAGMSIGNYLDPTIDMNSKSAAKTAATVSFATSFDRPLDKSELFPDLTQPPTVPQTNNDFNGAPELTTVTMYWNDLPGLLIQGKQYVRLVDIHKQVLPAKDTGILKKRCQMMGLEIRNCSELQRDFLIRYMNAAKSKSTVIVSKDKAQVLIGFYVDPRPRTSVSRNSSTNDLTQIERASSTEPDYEAEKSTINHADKKRINQFNLEKAIRAESSIHRIAKKPVTRPSLQLPTDDNVKRSARLKDKKVQYAAMLHGGWMEAEETEPALLPQNNAAKDDMDSTPVRTKNGRLMASLKKKLILEDNSERTFPLDTAVAKVLEARSQQISVTTLDKVRKLASNPDELELRKLISKQKHKKLNKKDKLRIIKLRERIRKKQKQAAKVTGLSAQLTERHLAERKKKWLANLEKARQKQREKREANKTGLTHEHCYATSSGLTREGHAHGEIIISQLKPGTEEHLLLTSNENIGVVTVEHPLMLSESTNVLSPQVKNGMETPPPTPKPSPKVNTAEDNPKRQPLAVIHRDLVHRNGRGRAQAGDLHLTLYKTKDSQCIQCVKCQDFFNVTRFLKHMHHFNHIDELLEVTLPQKLELNSESPTPPEILLWDEFKQRRQDFIKNNRNARKRAESRRKQAAANSGSVQSSGSTSQTGKVVKSNSSKAAVPSSGILTPPGSDTKKSSRAPVSENHETAHVDIVTTVNGASPLLANEDSPDTVHPKSESVVIKTPKTINKSLIDVTTTPDDCSPGNVRTSQRTRKRKQFYPIEGYVMSGANSQPPAKRSRRESEGYTFSKNG